jgi:hypothetical protein
MVAGAFLDVMTAVRSEVTALGDDGPFRLTVVHANGTIVEYFNDTGAALRRQGELLDLLAAARGGAHPGGPLA